MYVNFNDLAFTLCFRYLLHSCNVLRSLIFITTLCYFGQAAKLLELYKQSSDDWSKKSHELEGVIKALEVRLMRVRCPDLSDHGALLVFFQTLPTKAFC